VVFCCWTKEVQTRQAGTLREVLDSHSLKEFGEKWTADKDVFETRKILWMGRRLRFTCNDRLPSGKDSPHSIAYSVTFSRLDWRLNRGEEWRTISEPTFCRSSETEGCVFKSMPLVLPGSEGVLTSGQYVEALNLKFRLVSLAKCTSIKIKLISKTSINDIT